MGKAPSVGICKDIDLNLLYAARRLRAMWGVMVVQAQKSLGILHLQVFPLAWRKPGVIAVVRADHLNLVEVHNLVLRCLRIMLRPYCLAEGKHRSARHNL